MGTDQVPLWTLPYRRNPFFTGREAVLTRIHAFLQAQPAVFVSQPAAISGLGGIGKTQIAIEYAYRYAQEYQFVLWVQADTHNTLTSDFVALAHLLNLPERDAQDLTLTVESVKEWLDQHTGWLLILDNADDLSLVDAFLPARPRGHILFTTRTQLVGGRATRVEMAKMHEEEGTRFLLRRISMLAPDAPLSAVPEALHTIASTLVNALDGLPLALDQAGAYIEETGCGLPRYLDLYHTQRKALLARRSKRPTSEHPEPVATTWSLSFECIEQANPAAAEVLRCCAFLHPDAIPEELLTQGASHVSPALQEVAADPLRFDEVISDLLNYSLLRRLPDTAVLSMHQLVQVVLKDAMDSAMQKRWAERIIQLVDHSFPFSDVATWEQCQRYLPHAMLCADSIEQGGFISLEAAHLLYNVASYLDDRGQYPQAEPLFQCSLAIYERVLGPEHPSTAHVLNHLAILYVHQGKDEQAELFYQRALATFEQVLGPEHPATALTLNNLATLYGHQGKNEQAEPLLQHALTISEQVRGPEHPDTARILNNLALLYKNQGRYEQAGLLLQRALAIREQVRGPEHPDTARILNNLAILYRHQERDEQAEQLYQRALAIRERVLGPKHPSTIQTLQNYVNLLRKAKRDQEATTLEVQIEARKAKGSRSESGNER